MEEGYMARLASEEEMGRLRYNKLHVSEMCENVENQWTGVLTVQYVARAST